MIEWRVVEWPEGEPEPTKYLLSTLPEDTQLEVLVDTIKLRWRIERDYEDLKSERGLAHFEGRGWRKFHHHASLCIAAYGFLILERSAFRPSGPMAPRKPALSGRRSIRTRRRSVPNGHVVNSIATTQKRLTIALAKSLYRCQCCNAVSKQRNSGQHL